MAKLNLTYEEKKHLDNWNIDVKPYLTFEEMEHIVNMAMMQKTSFERDQIVISSVIVVCTDLYREDDDTNYTYEEILYSGLWKDIMQSCPILNGNIETIYAKIAEARSIEQSIINFLGELSDGINGMNISKDDVKNIVKTITGSDE